MGKPTERAIIDILEGAYVDKVIDNLGLVVTLYDVVSVGDGYIYHSDGGAHFKVTFRPVIFRPFKGEFLTGTVTSADVGGIYVSLDFFRDVFIPKEHLLLPSRYDPHESTWMWLFEGDSALYYDRNHSIRFRVDSVTFQKPNSLQASSIAPMRVIGRVDEGAGMGLGMSHWYDTT